MLYYRFKPNVPFWMVVVVLRKMCMALITILFHSSAAFQLAMLLLVLFVCLVIQMRTLPYASPSQYQSILETYAQRVDLLNEELKQCARAKDVAARGRRRKRGRLGIDDVRTTEGRIKLRDAAVELIFEYNAVEGSLLSASILICLMGVMLDSDYVDNGKHVYTRQALIQATVAIIAASFIYFTVVLWYEIIAAIFPSLMCTCFGVLADSTRVDVDKADDSGDAFDPSLEMADINPQFAKEVRESTEESTLMTVQEQIAMSKLVKDLQEENRNLKHRIEQGAVGQKRFRNVGHKTPKKKDFNDDDVDTSREQFGDEAVFGVQAERRGSQFKCSTNPLSIPPRRP